MGGTKKWKTGQTFVTRLSEFVIFTYGQKK